MVNGVALGNVNSVRNFNCLALFHFLDFVKKAIILLRFQRKRGLKFEANVRDKGQFSRASDAGTYTWQWELTRRVQSTLTVVRATVTEERMEGLIFLQVYRNMLHPTTDIVLARYAKKDRRMVLSQRIYRSGEKL